MFDANIVIAKCIEAVYEGAERYRPVRIGTWAGRVIPLSDGSQTVKIRVNIVYPSPNGGPGGIERYAPVACTIDNSGQISLKDGRE